ncbi:hypothetical protein [Pajaroellobacter abortibovis]|uniref:hypothetical protein n=1 Tax=Pajaroellobacter abortibovis TaxID=1882918 RepID=UPI0012EC395B|nr:hypothetical protein [Pajaroellobacter abortibovis]
MAKRYGEAEARLSQMLDTERGTLHETTFVSHARMVWGVMMIATDRQEEVWGGLCKALS